MVSGNGQYGADKLVCIIRYTPTATAKEIIMKLKDLLRVMDDITQLEINADNFNEPLYIPYLSNVPTNLLDWEIDYIGAKNLDVLVVFLIEKK